MKYKDISVLLLVIFYNPQDIINILKLYFVDLKLNVTDIVNWLGVYTLNLLHLKSMVIHSNLFYNINFLMSIQIILYPL